MRLMDAYNNTGFRNPNARPFPRPPRQRAVPGRVFNAPNGHLSSLPKVMNRTRPAMADAASHAGGTWGGIERGIQTFGRGKDWLPYARWGAVGGLGIIGVQNARRTFDSARNGDVAGTLTSGALAGAALMGAYHYGLNNGSMRQHLGMVAKAVGPSGAIQQGIRKWFGKVVR